MDELHEPRCSHETDGSENQSNLEEAKSQDLTVASRSIEPDTPRSFTLAEISAGCAVSRTSRSSVPLIIRSSFQNPIVFQPRSGLQSPMSTVMPVPNQPPTLFLQALSKLNESSIPIPGLNYLNNATQKTKNNMTYKDITPPDSLTSAPPSYSFVLRQMTARRRPRLMGTFIPSPSFVQHTPPPNYATAFDIYVDNHIPPPPPRVCEFGFSPMPAVCPECGFTGMTICISKITLCTHMCAFILCVFCCWICAPLPYMLRSCKDVYHYCRNCRTFLGLYCPTNPEHNYR